jgi:COX assembly protein 2
MHPPLFRPHPDCQKFVEELVSCHETKNIAKWWGGCNDVKAGLDLCFAQEKIRKRDANLKEAREFDVMYEAKLKRKEEAKVAAAAAAAAAAGKA